MAHSSEIEKLERRWADNPLGLTFAPLAEAHRRAGDHARALEVLETGLAHHPAYVPALIVQARCHLDAGLDGAAESSFRSVLVADGHNLIALKGLADICESTGRLDETRRHLERLLEADPTHEEASGQLARAVALFDARAVVALGETEPVVEVAAPMGVEPASTQPAPADLPAPWSAPEALADDTGDFLVLESTEVDLPDSAAASQVEGAPLDELGSEALAEPAAGEMPAPPDLELERDTNPFEGFDPAGWDLPFNDSPAPPVPFEETAALADVSVEQVYQAPAAGVELPADDGLVHTETMTDDADTPASMPLEDAFPGFSEQPAPAVSTGTDATGPEMPTPPAEIESLVAPMSEMPAPPAEIESLVAPMSEMPTPPAEIESSVAPMEDVRPVEDAVAPEAEGDAAMVPRDPLDIPDFAFWDTVAEPMTAEPAEPAMLAPPAVEPEPAGLEQTDSEVPAASAAEWNSGDDTGEVVELVEGGAEEFPVDPPESGTTAEDPDLVITETMALVFLRQGHKPLALAVYAQLLERDPANPELAEAVARLRGELLPAAEPSGASPAAAAEESIGAFLARVLGPEGPAPGPESPAPQEAPVGGRPTQPAEDPSLSLTAIFGEDAARGGPPVRRAAGSTDAEPSFDEFFGALGGAQGVTAGVGGDEADLEQFNAWLRGLQR